MVCKYMFMHCNCKWIFIIILEGALDANVHITQVYTRILLISEFT